MDIKAQLGIDFGFSTTQITNTLALFDEGATIPFVARYRKEHTGSLDEIQLRDLQHQYDYYKELEDRRATILESIQTQGKLTPELSAKITATLSKTELEDLYLPYKPKRTTRATKAKDAGLEPLARQLLILEDAHTDLAALATPYMVIDTGYDTADKTLAGACDIIAEEMADDAEARKELRRLALDEGHFGTTVKKEFAQEQTKFQMYYDYKENVATTPSHRMLAMLRGEKEKVLRLELVFPRDKAASYLGSRFIPFPQSAAAPLLKTTIEDCIERLLSVATETEIRKEIRSKAETEAFKVFGSNLRELLMASPAGQLPVLGVDPGFRSGCKVVALDALGAFLQYETIFPHEPRNDFEASQKTIRSMIAKHGIRLIAIGNGTASRETDSFIRACIADMPAQERPISVVVSEAGASVYSASDVAIGEFPDFDLTVRGSISIARRLQDPLSELVKIDPKAIGVGQYQHDVNQALLKSSLEEIVESCVNNVGVNINLASEELLRHVSGLTRTNAQNIVRFRKEHGAFTKRAALLKVPGLGPKTFEQAAGFLRIPDAHSPLDNSAVHPERYPVVETMAAALGTSVDSLIGNKSMLATLDLKNFVSDTLGLPTLVDIVAELEKPGRDPRATFSYAKFNDAVQTVSDLKPGMILEGTVTNVTNFGAFIDIGVHQDGLAHISELADKFISDPSTVVKAGQVVKVRVLTIDEKLKRVALSLRINETRAAAPDHKTDTSLRMPPQQAQRTSQSSSDKIRQWQSATHSSETKLKTVKPKFNIRQIVK